MDKKYRIITSITDIDTEQWDSFVENHTNGNIFQTPYYYHVLKDSAKTDPVILILFSESTEKIIGVWLAAIQKEYSGIGELLTARAVTVGGPLIKEDDTKVLSFFIQAYNKIVKNKVIYSQIRNLFEVNYSELFQEYGFKYIEHLNLIHDLTLDEDELWKRLNGKRRNEIRKAYKEGVTVEVTKSNQDILVAYDILKEVYHYAKIPLSDFDFFQNLIKYTDSKRGVKLFVAKYEGEIIGCMFTLVYKHTIYDFYAGSFRKYYKKNPNDIIPWEVFKWGKDNGFRIFDFGGAGKPDEKYGVRDYKKKFGGDLVQYGRFEKIHNKPLFFMMKLGFIIWKII